MSKKVFTKCISVFLVAVMLLTSAPLAGLVGLNMPDWAAPFTQKASAKDATVVKTGACGENATYTLYDNGKFVISGTGAMWDYFSNQPLCQDFYSEIVSVEIEEGITKIGTNAFSDCSELTYVSIPDGVTSIGHYAFRNCSGLTSVNIPDSVTSIGVWVFFDCSGLTSVNIPDGVTSIGDCTFSGCSSLTSINIPNSVTSIGMNAFYDCSGLTSVNIPNSVTSIGMGAFNHCSGLTSVNIPDSVTSIGDYAFAVCLELTSINIPNSVTSIGKFAFANCLELTSVNIPNSVTSIGNGAFNYCENLKDVYFGGTDVQWNAITIGSNNEPLLNATIHATCVHTYGEWVTEKEASCFEAGKKHRTCSKCNEKEIAQIEILSHTDINNDGKCDNCGTVLRAITVSCSCGEVRWSTHPDLDKYKVATVSAPIMNQDKYFVYWTATYTDGTTEIASTYRTYSFFATRDVSLTPVYVATESEYRTERAKALIVSRVTGFSTNNDGSASLIVEHSVSPNAIDNNTSIIGHGVVYTENELYKNSLNINNESDDVINKIARTSANNLTGLLEVNVGNASKVWATPYIIDENGVVHYGTMKELGTSSIVSFDEAFVTDSIISFDLTSFNEGAEELVVEEPQPIEDEQFEQPTTIFEWLIKIITTIVENLVAIINNWGLIK